MDKYKEYLAVNVLNESRVVDFRLLSRAMKIHVNLAKQMLYEFHRTQNARKPGTVHAIYYLEGTKAAPPAQTNGLHSQDDEDSIMQSSPFMSSMQEPEQPEEQEQQQEQIMQRAAALAQESELEEKQEVFEVIDTMFIYGLASGPLDDLKLLSECSRRVAAEFGSEDPLQAWKTYGVIQNKGVRRRSGKRPPRAAPAAVKAVPKPAAAVKSQPEKLKPSDTAMKNGVDGGSAVRTAAGAHAKPISELTTSKQGAPTIKREKSDIFKSFAKAKPKAKQDSTAESQPKDEPMLSDEGEDDEVPQSNAEADEAHRKARAEREEGLRMMMEDDGNALTRCQILLYSNSLADEEMADAPPAEPEAPVEEEEAAPIDKAPPPQKEEKEAYVEVSGGRRRGRRRIIKKKTTRDEEGYLVTKEEPVWESFSEDEPAPPPKKTKLPSAAPAKGKKGQGHGNIMNFFTKK
ncbi:hypothetical protein NA57DRAFT_63930 [Rhizodiscina lignyota]|uniref:DNA polymerase delta subunit 3 n=1 Tax=Rhizodiscina lignyota TaxID=1504668 RepID=A0A9P4IQ72_9PEZI|nr:hypothetical protein NA57DRAFT_63930 [Rhizodiscina lignyota]